MRRVIGDGLRITARSMAVPWMLGLRWAGRIGTPDRSGMPVAEPSLGLLAKAAIDELFLVTEILSGPVALGSRDRGRIAAEAESASRLFEQRGWLDDPTSYHDAPPPLERVAERSSGRLDPFHTHLSFESGYVPHASEPGRARWRCYEANRTAHARLLRHPGPPRPWVVCIPGYRMGSTVVDMAGFRTGWLHKELGLNVAVMVLPFHGPRRVGRRSGDGFLAGDLLDTIHAQSQAIWDLRRLVGWLRRQGAPSIAAYGLSLGGYTAALLAALEDRLDAVVAGIPASCFLGLVRSHAPAGFFPVAEWLGFPFERFEALLRVVSPLAMSPRVAREGRFLFAGTADRLAPPDQAWALWRHWERPRVAWYHGSHVSFLFEPAVPRLLREALHPEALAARSGARHPTVRLRPRPPMAETRGEPVPGRAIA